MWSGMRVYRSREKPKLKALYYPHTEIANESILKTALLLWDEIRTIYPAQQPVRHAIPASRESWEAAELVVRHTAPSDAQMLAAQKQLERMLDAGTLHRICAQPTIAVQGRSVGQDAYRGAYRIYHSKSRYQTRASQGTRG